MTGERCGLCGELITGEPAESWENEDVTYLHHDALGTGPLRTGPLGTGLSCFVRWVMGERP